MANEKRLIDANALMDAMSETFCQCVWEGCESEECQIALETIAESPTVDAVEVVHGRWVHHYNDSDEPIDDKWYCSECHMCNDHKRTWYCPNCGAKMDGGAYEAR